MAKRVKFPLDMGNEIMVRDIDELKANYNAEKVTEYFLNGKLLTWLEDRYYDEEAAQVKSLADSSENDPAVGLGRIFGIEISSEIDVEMLKNRAERLAKLREITSDDEIISNVDLVAFDQEELSDLLDEEKQTIYLCGDKFRLPISVKNVRYIGVNSPTITISGNEEIDLEEIGITIEKCTFSEDTQARLKEQAVTKAQTARKQYENSSESVWHDFIPYTDEKNFIFEYKDDKLCLKKYVGRDEIVKIPDNVNIIGEEAFKEAKAVFVIIPDSVSEIDEDAFIHSNLKIIIIPDSVTYIGRCAFMDSKIKNIKLPYGLTKINNSLFYDSSLENIIIPDTVTEIEEAAFQGTKIKTIELPYGITKISRYLFDNSSLESIKIPETVIEIEESAFFGTKIKNIELPNSIIKIGDRAFSCCYHLKNINIPENVIEIDDWAFNVTPLESINLPDGIKRIGSYVFSSAETKVIYRGKVYDVNSIGNTIRENQQ